jgi:hypothetical protein
MVSVFGNIKAQLFKHSKSHPGKTDETRYQFPVIGCR